MELEYNEEIHIESLHSLLSEKEPCSNCPAMMHIYKNIDMREGHIMGRISLSYEEEERYNFKFIEGYSLYRRTACDICLSFIDIDDNIKSRGVLPGCPCNLLGKEEAIKRTWIKLEQIDRL